MFTNVAVVFVLICLNINVQIKVDGLSNYETLAIGKYYCPAITFCTLNTTTHAPAYSCCEKCSCEENCVETQTCCPDAVESSAISTNPEISCENGYYVNGYCKLQKEKGKYGQMYYKMIAHCSDGHRCETPDAKTFDDLVIVVDENTDTLYRNKKCAKCNGVADYSRWRLAIVSCSEKIGEYSKGKGTDEVIYFILNQCLLLSLPPDAEDTLERYMCYGTDYISKCNETNRWDEFDADIQNACINPSTVFPYKAPSWDGTDMVIYKNVYCYLCNNPTNISRLTPDVCWNLNDMRDVFVEFSQLLDVQLSAELPQVASRRVNKVVCLESEMFDTFHNVCREVHCYDWKVASYGQCKQPLVSYSKFKPSIQVWFKLTPIVIGIKITNNQAIAENNHLLEYIKSAIKIPHCDVSIREYTCYLFLHFPQQYVDNLFVVADIMKTTNCGYEDIYNGVSALIDDVETMTIRLIVDGIPYEFIIEYFHGSFKNYPAPDNELILPKQNGNTYQTVSNSKLSPLLCPYVILNEEEYCKIVDIHLTKNNIATVDNNTCPLIIGAVGFPDYYVCVDTFVVLSRVDPVKIETKPLNIKGVLSLVISCMSMISIILSLGIYMYYNRLKGTPMSIFTAALINLFIAQAVFQFGSGWKEYKRICEALGVVLHYTWLAAVFAMNAFCIIVRKNLNTIQSTSASKTTLLVSIAYIYGLPVCFVLTNVVYSSSINGFVISGYGTSACNVDSQIMRGLLFSLPILLTVVLNFIVFLTIVYKIRRASAVVASSRKDIDYGSVYFRLLLTSGVAWLLGLINQFIGTIVLDYLFILMVAGQGIFLLLSILSTRGLRHEIMMSFSRRFSSFITTKSGLSSIKS